MERSEGYQTPGVLTEGLSMIKFTEVMKADAEEQKPLVGIVARLLSKLVEMNDKANSFPQFDETSSAFDASCAGLYYFFSIITQIWIRCNRVCM
jgi:hypothetical protein